MGWNTNDKCFVEIQLKKIYQLNILITLQEKIKYKKKLSFYKQYIKNYTNELGKDSEIVAIITPDKEIVENSNIYSPAYLIYNNYEIILKWNRSLRFAFSSMYIKG